MIFFTSSQIIIRRQKFKSGLRYAFSATGTVQDADIQPMPVERVNQVGGQIGKTYDAFIDSSISIKEGDQIQVVGTTKIYTVKAVTTYSGAGLLDHHQLILMSQD